MRAWQELPEISILPDMASAAGGHPLVARILAQRGITSPQAVQAFFDPVYYLPSPPGELPGMEAAAARLQKAQQDGETVCVWGDFDVDGQTSTTLLVAALRDLGIKVIHHIPIRDTESHGVHLATLRPILEQHIGVLLTCDTGVTATEEVLFANRAGVDVIITDHHDLPETLPPACAVVNPKLLPSNHPLANLPGAGVAYKLVEELYRRAGQPERAEAGLDLAALGIVADLAILKDDTRYLLQRGLPALRSTSRQGLRLMMELAELNPAWLSEEHISFVLAPRLNALGRLADANSAVEFFTTQDIGRAHILAEQLEGLNQQRKLLTDQVYQAAEAQIERNPALLDYTALVLAHATWPAGVIGIVASRLVDRYNRPVVLFSAPTGGIARGSARSVENVNISASIADLSGMLVTYGGHPMAAGLAIKTERIDQFRSALSQAIQTREGMAPVSLPLQIDGNLPLGELTLPMVDDLERLAPFGPGNPALTLCSPGMALTGMAPVGRNEEHLQMVVEDSQGNAYRVIYWQGAGMQPEIKEELQQGKIDLAYHARASDYFGQRSVQVEFVDGRLVEAAPIEIRPAHYPVEVIDCRREPRALWLLAQIVTQQSTLVWAEADARLELTSRGVTSMDRSHLVPSNCLAVWTTPPGRRELQEALDTVHPRAIYLFGVDPKMVGLQDFLVTLAGLVKSAINTKQGKVSLSFLATYCGQRTITASKGLEWLAARGNIRLLAVDGDEITIAPLSGGKSAEQNTPRIDELAGEIKALLAETAAFRSYFARAAKEDLITS